MSGGFLHSVRRWLGGSRGDTQTGITVWQSGSGPICYMAPVLRQPVGGATLPERLLASDLGWCWASGRLYPPSESDNPDLPAIRPIHPLTEATAPLLLAELQEQRWLTLFGVEPEGLPALLNPLEYQAVITAFAREEAGPLRLALYQEGDQPYELVFVPHTPAPLVRDLLAGWGITPATVRETRRVDSSTDGFIETFAPYA